MTNYHIIIGRTDAGQRVRSRDAYEWNDAQAIWDVLDKRRIAGELTGFQWFGVRASDDLAWCHAAKMEVSQHTFSWILEEKRRKERGKFATKLLNERPDLTFHQLLYRLANETGCAEWEAERALKDRVLIARCDQKHAWYWKKAGGSFWEKKCPTCDGSLQQTTLALRRDFRRYDVAA